MNDRTTTITIETDRLDSPVGSELIQRLVMELHARYPEEGPCGALDPEEFVPPNGVFIVVRIEGQPAGCGAFRRMDEGVAELKRMFVEPWARGRGFSRRILNELESAALESGYRVLRLETGIRQPEAIRLYETSGYRPIPCYGEYANAPLSVCFEKALQSG